MTTAAVAQRTTLPGVFNEDGSPVTVEANTVVVTPWTPEGSLLPTPQQGAINVANNLAQNTNSSQQPGVL